jgi:HK97 family phage major capsid protein
VAGAGELSFGRYLKGLATGTWENAEPERNVFTTAMSEGVLTAGGHLVPSPLAATIIDLARNQMRVVRAGAISVPMMGATLKVPRLTGEGTPAWLAENAATTAADLAFDSVTFTARTLRRLVVLSIELFDDADPSAADIIARSFAAQIALEVDRVALRGSGTAPEPRGVLNTSGITTLTHGANGSVIGSPPAAGTMGWAFLVDSVATVRNNNFEPNAQIMAPRTPQSLAKLRDTTNQYIAPPTYLDDVERLQTKQIPVNLTVGTSADCSEVYTGQFNQLMIGIRINLEIAFLRERFVDNGQYGFFAWLRADVQLAQPAPSPSTAV